MSEFSKESLSALLDGEIDDLELRRLLRQSETDSSVLDTWNRYNHVQSALVGDTRAASPSFLDAISTQIQNEQPLQRSKSGAAVSSSSNVSWHNPLAKMAVAASVALVFVFSFQSISTTSSSSSTLAGAQSEPVPFELAPTAILASGEQIVVDPAAEQRLRDFIGAIEFDEDEPVRIEHIQDSPLYRLVNQLEEKP